VSPPPPSPVGSPRLVAKLGAGSISLTTGSGKKVRQIVEGRYTLVIRDTSATDNVHLTGPRVNRKTGIAARGTFTWKVKLVPGTYRLRSDAHPKRKTSFKVLSRNSFKTG
jgi:hypothetical protein